MPRTPDRKVEANLSAGLRAGEKGRRGTGLNHPGGDFLCVAACSPERLNEVIEEFGRVDRDLHVGWEGARPGRSGSPPHALGPAPAASGRFQGVHALSLCDLA